MEYNNKENKIFKIMTYNVRCCDDTLRYNIDGTVKTRSKYVINNIIKYMPDLVGFQEVTFSGKKKSIWFDILQEGLKNNYIAVGSGRDSDLKGEGTPIFVNKNTLDIISFGNKWLSNEPEKPGSKFKNSKENPTDGIPRIFTYVIVKNKINNFEYMHINTHLDYKVSSNRVNQVM